MDIRRRLTFQFTLIVAVILFLAEMSTYIFSELKWKEDFYSRLYNKASAVAKLLVDVEGVDADILRLIEKNNLSTLPFEEIHIYDSDGQQLFSSRDSSSLVITSGNVKEIRGSEVFKFTQGNYTMVGFRYIGSSDTFVVIAGAIDIYGMRKLSNLRNILIIVFLISLIILYLSGRLFSSRAINPILKVMNEVPAITETTLHLRVNEGKGKDEIARLAKTFNRMLERLEAAFKIQQSFIANASHEIRTPLSHISGRLEVSLMKERTGEEYTCLIQSVLEDIVKLGNTANRLLLLTMTDADSPHVPMEGVRVDELIWEAQAEVQKSNAEYKIAVRFAGEIEAEQYLCARGNNQLLRIAFLNLMENGCKYSEDHRVEVVLEHRNGMIQVGFRDTGIGIPAEEQDLVFEPFYRARNVTLKHGSGLGLSLVKRITLLHSGTLSLRSEPGKGSEFILRFPTFTDA